MALKLDNSLIEELGLGALPEHEKQLLLRQIYEKLEMNVGVRLADQMSNEQLDEFEKFVDANDDKGAFQWLETNFPNYKDVVNEEFEKLKAEIKQYAPQMLAAAQHNSIQAAGASVQAAGQPQPPMPAAPGGPNGPGGQYPGQYPSQYPGQFSPQYNPPAAQPNPYQPAPQPSYGQPSPYYGPQPAGYGQPMPQQSFGAPQPQPPYNPAPTGPAPASQSSPQQTPPYPQQQPPAGPGGQSNQQDQTDA